MESEIGGMDEYAMAEQFGALAGEFAACVTDGTRTLAELGGRAQIALRIKRDGHPRWVYLRESTLGDRATEKCVLDVARRQRWPRPLGGEGLAEGTFEIEPSRAPRALDARRVVGAVVQARNLTNGCRRGIDGRFQATAYVDPRGHVLSAGVAPPHADAESAADCVAEALAGVRFGFVGGPAAKVTFEL